MKNQRTRVIMAATLLGVGLLLTGIIASAALPQSTRFESVHPMSTVPPLMGFSADSVFNTGTAQQLDAFPGIGTVLAQRIIEGRDAYGPYCLPTDLLLIKGIGTKTVAAIVAALTEPLTALSPMGE